MSYELDLHYTELDLPKNCRLGVTNNPDKMITEVSEKSKVQNIVYNMLHFYENRQNCVT